MLLAVAKRGVIELRHRRNEARRARSKETHGLDPDRWDARISARGHLEIAGCDLADVARQYGTPLIVVDRQRLANDYARFSDAFLAEYPNVEIAYSYKTNPVPGVLELLHEFGAMAEVISHFELWLALQLGVSPEKIIVNGPGKCRDLIELAVARGVRMINVDSIAEIDSIAAAARARRRRQTVGVRVTTSVGWVSQFGFAIKNGEAREAFRRIVRNDALVPAGLHVHLGTDIRSVEPYGMATRELLELVQQLRASLGIAVTTVDLGGGFAVPTVQPFDNWDQRLMRHALPPGPIAPDTVPSPQAYAQAIFDVVSSRNDAGMVTRPTFVLEPGRAVTSSAQCLLLRVLAVKRATGPTPIVILDGGNNVAGPLGYEQHELLPVSCGKREVTNGFDFYGPLCHPGDLLFKKKRFVDTAPGDIVAIMDAGAYFVPNQRNFSHPRPAVVLLDAGEVSLLRSRESFADLVRSDRAGRRQRHATACAV